MPILVLTPTGPRPDRNAALRRDFAAAPICYALPLGWGASDAICSTEATRVYHAARQCCSRMAARGARAAVGDARDRAHGRGFGCGTEPFDQRFSAAVA